MAISSLIASLGDAASASASSLGGLGQLALVAQQLGRAQPGLGEAGRRLGHPQQRLHRLTGIAVGQDVRRHDVQAGPGVLRRPLGGPPGAGQRQRLLGLVGGALQLDSPQQRLVVVVVPTISEVARSSASSTASLSLPCAIRNRA